MTIDVQASTSPYNDRFSEPQVITSITETGSTMWATLQTGEPNPVSISAGASGSIWFQYTVERTTAITTLVISTAGSNFNTLLAAYHGTNLGSLRLLDSNDNCDQTSTTSCVTLTVKPMASDFVIQLQVDGRRGDRGDVSISVTASQEFVCKMGPVRCAVNDDCCSRRCVGHTCARG